MTVSYYGNAYGAIFNDLHNLLQNLYPKIKFTIEHYFKGLSVLDILIKSQNGQIIIDIYCKPLDIQQYLHVQKSSPQKLHKSIPYPQHVESAP